MAWLKYAIEAAACLWALGIGIYLVWDLATEEW